MVISSLAAIMPPWRGKSIYPGRSVFPSHLSVTDPIRILMAPGSACRTRADAAGHDRATVRAANSIGLSGAGGAGFPPRASLRHAERWLALNPCRPATSRMPAPAAAGSEKLD
jgi:hypothetical protein